LLKKFPTSALFSSAVRWLGLALITENPRDFLRNFLLGTEEKKEIERMLSVITEIPSLQEKALAERKRVLALPEFPHLAPLFVSVLSEENKIADSYLALLKIRDDYEKRNTLNPTELLTGAELLKLGLKAGPNVGKALKLVRDAQLNEEIVSKEEAIDLLKEHGFLT